MAVLAAARRIVRVHRTDIGWALALFAVAFVLRLAFVLWIDPNPRLLTSDSFFYNSSARALANGDGYIFLSRGLVPTAHWPPGYSGMLAAVYLLPGPDVLAGQVLNVVLGSTTCVLLFAIGRIAWDRRVGIGAGTLMTFFPSHVFASTILMTEVTWAAMMSGLFLFVTWVVVSRKRYHIALALVLGLLVGATTLTRGEGVLLPLVFGGVWLAAGQPWRRAALLTGACLVGLAVVLSGWTARNAIELGAPVPISTGSSSTLAQSHWSGADGGPDFERGVYVQRQFEGVPYPERELKWSQKAMRDALRYMATHPGHELALIPRRFFELYRHDHAPIDYIQKPAFRGAPQEFSLGDRGFGVLSGISDGYYFAVIALAVVGARLWWRTNRAVVWLLVGTLVYVSAVFSLVFLGEPRYHASTIPALVLLAAPALAGMRTSFGGVLGRKK